MIQSTPNRRPLRLHLRLPHLLGQVNNRGRVQRGDKSTEVVVVFEFQVHLRVEPCPLDLRLRNLKL